MGQREEGREIGRPWSAQFERTQITQAMCVAWVFGRIVSDAWASEVGAESSQSIGKYSLSIAQGRCKFSERKQKRLTLRRQGWEPSISWPPTIGTQCSGHSRLEGGSKEIPPPHSPTSVSKRKSLHFLPCNAWSLASIEPGVVRDGNFSRNYIILMYLQVCLDLFPLPASLNIPSLMHPNSYFGYTIRWSPPNLNIWIRKAD